MRLSCCCTDGFASLQQCVLSPLILCRRREHSGGGRHREEERRRPAALFSTFYLQCMSCYCCLVSPLPPLFSPALSDTLPILTRPRISGKSASRGYALRLYSLPRDDKRRSGSRVAPSVSSNLRLPVGRGQWRRLRATRAGRKQKDTAARRKEQLRARVRFRFLNFPFFCPNRPFGNET